MDGHDFEQIAFDYYKLARRVVKVVVGLTLLLFGIALVFLPGPAFVVIPVALAILAGEFVWARKLLRKIRREVKKYTGLDMGARPFS